MTQAQYELDFYKTPAERRILEFRHKGSYLENIIRPDYFEADLKALLRLYRKGKLYLGYDGEVMFC